MTATRRLPHPTTDRYDWQLHAACRGRNGALFFARADEGRSERHEREAAAKRVCAECPVSEQCLEHALTAGEPYGVWGGMNEHERQALPSRSAASA